MKYLVRLKKFSEFMFTKHLFVTNTSLGIFFFGLADVAQQQVEKKMYEGKTFELKRTGNIVVSGSVIGVAGHFWYSFLDRKFPGASYKQVTKKLLSEMVIGPPVILAFFVTTGLLEGKSAKRSFEEFKRNFMLILVADWAIYAPLQALNFLYLHPKYRFLCVSALCFVYDMFLSYVVHKEDNKVYKKEESHIKD